MNILFYRYGSICEPDILEGFQTLGHSVRTIDAEITDKTISPGQIVRLLIHDLEQFPADFIFSINFYPAISELCNVLKLPYLCWIVDSPVLELYTKPITYPYNRIFTFDYTMYQEFLPLNPTGIFYLPLAVNISAHQKVIRSADNKKRQSFASDISFVGSLYTEKSNFSELTPPSDYAKGYINAIMEAQRKIYGYYFINEVLPEDIIQGYKQKNPDFLQFNNSYITDRDIFVLHYIGNHITVLERDEIMTRLSEKFSMDIYTASDTSKYPKLRNRGLANTFHEMPIIFAESKVNLNTTSKPIRSGLPLRIWDILGCGGFALTNYQADIPALLTIGEHLDTYGSMEELEEKCRYYLSHDKIRKEIAQNGFEEVQKNHTYEIRLEAMLATAFKP